jgi:hypothetical protein
MIEAKCSISASVVSVIFFSCSISPVDVMAGRFGAYSGGLALCTPFLSTIQGRVEDSVEK